MHAIRAKIGNCDSKKQSPPAAPLHGTSGSRSLNRINATAFSPGVYRGHHDWRSTFVGPSRAQQDHRLVKAQSAPRGGADPGSMDDSSGSSTQLPAAFSPESAGLDSRKVLTRAEAREVYDANGRKDLVKDSESVYGGPATQALLSAVNTAHAKVVYEFGHGSGRLAQRLLSTELPEQCTYVGVDQSEVMHSIAAARLEPFRERVKLAYVPDGEPSNSAAGLSPGSVDIFVSTYVLDLLSEEDIFKVLELAGRLLKDGGQLCLTGLTYGSRVGPMAAIATWIWEAVHYLRPKVVGGCRAQTLEAYLGPLWELKSSTVVSGGLVASEIIVCVKRSETAGAA